MSENFLNSFSYTPSLCEIIDLCAYERDIQCSILKKKCNYFNPDNTEFVKLGKNESNKNKYFSILSKNNMKFNSIFFCPIGILIDCNNYYGINRINLFRENPIDMIKLLEDYLDFRDSNLSEYLNIFLSELIIENNNSIDNKILPKNLDYHLNNTIFFIKKIINNFNCKIKNLGISCFSFSTNINSIKNHNTSPYFYTLFCINNINKLKSINITDSEIDSFNLIQEYSLKYFIKNNNLGKLINMDKLYEESKKYDISSVYQIRSPLRLNKLLEF